MKTQRSAFTLFELLAVLTITGVIFMVILGSYNSWSSMHACTGTADVLKSGLLQARALAQAKNRYVGFEFSTVTSNRTQQVSGFQLYICTNETGNTEQMLSSLQTSKTIAEQQSAVDAMGISLATPFQRLSNHIRLVSSPSPLNLSNMDQGAILFFRPDGSVWSGYDAHSHYAGIYTKRGAYSKSDQTTFDEQDLRDKKILYRFLRIDLATGSIETIKGEYINAANP